MVKETGSVGGMKGSPRTLFIGKMTRVHRYLGEVQS